MTTEQQAVVNAAAIAVLDYEAWLFTCDKFSRDYDDRTAERIVDAYTPSFIARIRLLNAALDAAETVRGCKPTTQKRADRPSRRAA